jgi:hypothetical protein
MRTVRRGGRELALCHPFQGLEAGEDQREQDEQPDEAAAAVPGKDEDRYRRYRPVTGRRSPRAAGRPTAAGEARGVLSSSFVFPCCRR